MGCHYDPGHFIEFTQEKVTVLKLLQEVYSDASFLYNIAFRILDATKPPAGSGNDSTNS